MAKNTTLVSLNLQGNSIGDEGAKALAEAVRTNSSKSLQKLFVPDGIKTHPELVAACKSKDVWHFEGFG